MRDVPSARRSWIYSGVARYARLTPPRPGTTGGRRLEIPPAPRRRSAWQLISVQRRRRNSPDQSCRIRDQRNSVRGRCPSLPTRSNNERRLVAARGPDGQWVRPWWSTVLRRVKGIKTTCCPRWCQHYVEKVNKHSISYFLYTRSYDNIELSAPFLLACTLIPYLLIYFLTTPVVSAIDIITTLSTVEKIRKNKCQMRFLDKLVLKQDFD